MGPKQYRLARRNATATMLYGYGNDNDRFTAFEKRVAEYLKRQWQTGSDTLAARMSSFTPDAASRLRLYPMRIGNRAAGVRPLP